MIELITDILNYYKHIKKDFDVYVIADTQERTKDLMTYNKFRKLIS